MRVVAVDRNAGRARASRSPTPARRSTSPTPEAVAEVGRTARGRRRHDDRRRQRRARSSRASPSCSACPASARETAHLATNKIAMRREFAERGVPQPQFAALRAADRGARRRAHGRLPRRAEAGRLGRPARHLPRARRRRARGRRWRSRSPRRRSEEVIVERYHEGREVNTLLVARDDDVRLITASDRLRPDGVGFGVALAHVYPSTLFGDALAEVERVAVAAVRAIGLRNGIAYPQLLVSPHGNEVRVVEIAARIPAGRWSRCRATASASTSSRSPCSQALGEPVPDELVTPRFQHPVAIRFLTAEPGPLPTGRRARRSGRSRRRSPFPASSASRRGSSRARRSGPCRPTATAAAT